MKALIVGYGRAGKRHERILQEKFNVATVSVDPDQHSGALYADYDIALFKEVPDIVVVATPPEFHLHQAEQALDFGAYVMCEKPLCGLGELEQANTLSLHERAYRMMVSYNYRYHPALNNGGMKGKGSGNWWSMECMQTRDNLPYWGLLLDHVSHDVDILMSTSHTTIATINRVMYDTDRGGGMSIMVEGMLDDGCNYRIHESIETKRHVPRYATISGPNGWISIDGDPRMYSNMWMAFMNNMENETPQYPGVLQALVTQSILEAISERLETQS